MNSKVAVETVVVNCPGYLASNSTSCSPFSGSVVNSDEGNLGCNAEAYTGSVCKEQLLAWQECTVGGAEDVLLDSMSMMDQSQQEKERDVAQFLYFLRELFPRLFFPSELMLSGSPSIGGCPLRCRFFFDFVD